MGGILVLLLYLLGIFWIVMGTLLVFVPKLLKRKLFVKLQNIPLKKIGSVPLIIGVLLVLAASHNRYTAFVVILGLLAIAKGIGCIVATEKMQKIQDWWLNKASNNIYRILGIVIILIGSIVLTGI